MDNEGNNETERQLQEDLKKTKIRRFWGFAHICRVLGHFGNGRHFSGLEFEDPLITLLDTLRSGQNISTENAVALADLIDNKSGLNIYQMRLVKVQAAKRKFEKKVQAADTIGEMEKILLSSKNVSDAVLRVSEILGIDERSVWRRWRQRGSCDPADWIRD